MNPEPTLRPGERLRRLVEDDLATLARRRRRLMGVITAIVLATAVVFAAHSAGRSWPDDPLVAWSALAAYVLGGLVLLALALGLKLPDRRRVVLATLATGLAGLGLLPVFVEPGNRSGAGDEFLRTGLPCLGLGGAMAVTIAGATLLAGRSLLRRHAPTALLLGLGAGLLAWVPLHLHCLARAAVHVLVWHALVPVVGVVFAAVLWARHDHVREPR